MRALRIVVSLVTVSSLVATSAPAGVPVSRGARGTTVDLKEARARIPSGAATMERRPDGSVVVDSGRADVRTILRRAIERAPSEGARGVVEELDHAFREQQQASGLEEPATVAASTLLPDEGVVSEYSAMDGGDLDGDGFRDTLLFEWRVRTADDTVVGRFLRAKRASDQHELWSVPFPQPFPVFETGNDFDGDGRHDLLTFSSFVGPSTVRPCGMDELCDSRSTETFGTRILVRTGSDGSVLWQDTIHGSLEIERHRIEAASVQVATAHQEVTITDAVAVVAIAPDHDGDGGADFVVNTYDVTATTRSADAGWNVYIDSIQSATTAEVRAGADGAATVLRSATLRPGFATLLPVGTVTTDSAADFLWQHASRPDPETTVCLGPSFCLGTRATTLALELLDGRTLDVAWRSEIARSTLLDAWVTPALADLDGDGAQDLALGLVDTTTGYEQGVVSGSDGRALWTLPTSHDDYFNVAGPIDAHAGDDIIFIGFGGDDATLPFTRVSGKTGEVLSKSERNFQPTLPLTLLVIWIFADHDGDGVLDPTWEALGFDFENSAGFEGEIESGLSRATLFRRKLAKAAGFWPTGDQNADGPDDLLFLRFDERRFTMDSYTLPSRALAWSVTEEFAGEFGVRVREIGDQSGQGGVDVLYNRAQRAPARWETRVDALDGSTGASRYWYGDQLTSPSGGGGGPVFTGGISGTIDDSDPSVAYPLCASAYRLDGSPAGVGRTVSDGGAFRIVGLPDGDYKVLIDDCGTRWFQEEWHADESSFEEAAVLTVADGAEVGGIAATLDRPPAPANDAMLSAEPVGTLPYADDRSTRGATREWWVEPFPPCVAAWPWSSVWYRLSTQDGGGVHLSTFGSDYDTILSVYAGPAPPASLVVACDDDSGGTLQSEVAFETVPGAIYWIQVSGYGLSTGHLRLRATRA